MVPVATLEPSAAMTMAKRKLKASVDQPTDVCRVVKVLLKPPKCSPVRVGKFPVPPEGGVKPVPPPRKPPGPPRTKPPVLEVLLVALTSAEAIGLLRRMPPTRPTTAPRTVKVVDSEMN
jgi:hypothetical protein